MNEAFAGVWFNIRLCYQKLMTSHMMRPQPFFFVVTLVVVVVVVGGYILVIHLSHMLTLCAEILVWDFVYTLTLHAVENSFS